MVPSHGAFRRNAASATFQFLTIQGMSWRSFSDSVSICLCLAELTKQDSRVHQDSSISVWAVNAVVAQPAPDSWESQGSSRQQILGAQTVRMGKLPLPLLPALGYLSET